jgi:bifunctional non-homologous end joining protein LigD
MACNCASRSSSFCTTFRIDALAIREAAVAGVKAKGAVWTAPGLRARIAYRGRTSGGELRKASFKGLREER